MDCDLNGDRKENAMYFSRANSFRAFTPDVGCRCVGSLVRLRVCSPISPGQTPSVLRRERSFFREQQTFVLRDGVPWDGGEDVSVPRLTGIPVMQLHQAGSGM